ncbi:MULTISPECIES: DUF2339 domain-containing protein [unclassified Agrobacterium]|uniref:DUF2339 domain-containing protein n=1 Tax=unclassified Agrobacterium TaxID=2632611 RepID=UPI00244D0B92|nr:MULTISPECIES: DUF2339 domain-containing protein [unclassified Agrobacterium]MDH0615445.1 DUF2339 domain-containing protein [Agrobacterium sp. GD03872]MDH0698492.1 DUF2339 domain-containing protein [Agrobacterium sp. GD03871]MDH1060671.1 DUF2339 domain-containing protein [Agrobacterium sp. GD03992]MDH2213096.1 DUF2339 domain-containing protein [Agrobacterium sp. GD03643]MDH2220816.1 DUF2339 domain-containing protein [Agrobacterium sp. GD03638]
MEIPLFILALVAAFIYTLVASIRNSSRIKSLEREVLSLKRLMAAGVTSPVAAQAESAESTAKPDFEAEEESRTPAEDAAFQAEYASEPQEAAAMAQAEDAVREDAPSATASEKVSAPATKESFESLLGARWAVWAGGLALALGGIFLVKYSIESGLLSPAVRLSLAAIFGLVLGVAGEAVRRKAVPGIAATYSNAMIPGVLTAAGALTLFGVVYAAYGIYGYIGPGMAFGLLGLVAFATIGLSLLHGQALAGLGLLGSMLTPALISTETPNIWALFVFLTISWLATAAAARRQGWTVVPSLANAGLGLWTLGYIGFSETISAEPPTLALLVMLAGTIFLWPGKTFDTPPAETGETAAPERRAIRAMRLLLRPSLALNLTVSMAVILTAIGFLFADGGIDTHPALIVSALIAALAALGAARHYAVWPAIIAALGAQAAVSLMSRQGIDFIGLINDTSVSLPPVSVGYTAEIAMALGLGTVFVLCAFSFLKRKGADDADFGQLWAGIAALFPVWLATASFVEYGNLGRDWLHAAYGLGLGLVLLAGAEWLHRQNNEAYRKPLNILVLGSFAAFALCLHTLTQGLATTVLLSVIGFVYVLATRYRNWDVLPWVMAVASVAILGRIAWEPTIVGPQNLGLTPVFNALLPGYGIPALLAVASAWLLRDWPGVRAKNFLQAIASVMGLLAVAILIRHAMNGGTLDDSVPTLGEQSIYTLLTIGFSGVLMTLDLKSPSPVFRYGSMIAGVIAVINVLTMHFFTLNPYFTGENTGSIPFLNLLLIGYLLPALAYGGLAYYARGKRPPPYVSMLAVAGAALGFAWATLSVRRFWQGENIADWKGFLQGETYSYSVVWLLIGVLLLVLGSRFNARSLRLASAAFVLISVAKAFLIDMSNLEGVLRALSFIGLGAVLIGIGLFYQKILTRKPQA